jgi:hypothetical protein
MKKMIAGYFLFDKRSSGIVSSPNSGSQEFQLIKPYLRPLISAYFNDAVIRRNKQLMSVFYDISITNQHLGLSY